MPRAPFNRSCTVCKDRHLRCDRKTPSCSNCLKSKYHVECSYEPARFKFRNFLSEDTETRSRQHQSASPGSVAAHSSTPSHSSRRRSGAKPPKVGETSLAETGESNQCDQVPETGELGRLSDHLPLAAVHGPQGTPTDTRPSGSSQTHGFVDDFPLGPLSVSPLLDTPSGSFPADPSVVPPPRLDKTEVFIFKFYLETCASWVSHEI